MTHDLLYATALGYIYQKMGVIWQNDPCQEFYARFNDLGVEMVQEHLSSFRGLHAVGVLIAGGRQQKGVVPFPSMRRRVRRLATR